MTNTVAVHKFDFWKADEDLADANVEALIAGEHLALITNKKKNDDPKVEV